MFKTPIRRDADQEQEQEVISFDCPPAPPRRDSTVHHLSHPRKLPFPTLHSPSATATEELEGFLLPPRKRLMNTKRKCIDINLGDLNLDDGNSNVDTGNRSCDASTSFPILPSHDTNYALQQGGPLKRIKLKLKPRRSFLE